MYFDPKLCKWPHLLCSSALKMHLLFLKLLSCWQSRGLTHMKDSTFCPPIFILLEHKQCKHIRMMLSESITCNFRGPFPILFSFWSKNANICVLMWAHIYVGFRRELLIAVTVWICDRLRNAHQPCCDLQKQLTSQ